MDMTPGLEQCVVNIMDCFTGADGGGRFWRFRRGLEIFEDRACNGDMDAATIIDMVTKFSRLIDVLNKA